MILSFLVTDHVRVSPTSTAQPRAALGEPGPPRASAATTAQGTRDDGDEPDDIVQHMPSTAEKSIESVARYVADRVPHGRDRVAVLHDWVADRIEYSSSGAASASATFLSRKAVCAGYASLLHELASAAGEDVSYVTGDAYSAKGELLGRHAWNEWHIGDHYEPLDATWDAGNVSDSEFHKQFSRRWLFPDRDEFRKTHVSDD